MVKAVFTSKPGSDYDDVPEERYHFPRTYLRAVEQTVGDQIVYRQPRRGGGDMAYFAVAFVTGIRNDETRSHHFYADIVGYLDFDSPVPFQVDGRFFEHGLRKHDGSVNRGAFGRSVRLLASQEFSAIVAAGFSDEPNHAFVETIQPRSGFAEETQKLLAPDRPAISFTRPFRDRAFAQHVQRAYNKTCAVTGLRLINGGGRPEVQAAHIKPVSMSGPDSVRNGLALSGTIHWLFDRGLMTFDDDYSIRTVKGAVPDQVQRIIRPDGHLLTPENENARPCPYFLRYHRENIFKG